MIKLRQIFNASLIVGSLISAPVMADWALLNDQSSVHFVSTKKQHIDEIHHFKQLSGNLTKDGQFKVSIDLASVESGIEIRNTRMKEQLFKVGTFPTATISAKLPANVMQLKNGHSVQVSLDASLNLMQTTNSLKLNVQVTKTLDGDYIATSIQPVLISADDVGLKQGIYTLQKLAGLPSIGLTVPVSFNVVLKAD